MGRSQILKDTSMSLCSLFLNAHSWAARCQAGITGNDAAQPGAWRGVARSATAKPTPTWNAEEMKWNLGASSGQPGAARLAHELALGIRYMNQVRNFAMKKPRPKTKIEQRISIP